MPDKTGDFTALKIMLWRTLSDMGKFTQSNDKWQKQVMIMVGNIGFNLGFVVRSASILEFAKTLSKCMNLSKWLN